MKSDFTNCCLLWFVLNRPTAAFPKTIPPASWQVRHFYDLFRSTPCKAYKGRGNPAAEQVPRSKSWKSGPNVSQKDRWPFCSDKNMVPVKGMIFNYFPFFLLLKKRNNQSTTLYSESKQTEAPWPWLDWCSRLRKNREKEAGKKNKNQNFTSMSTSDLQWL